jgi:hypothetical protein
VLSGVLVCSYLFTKSFYVAQRVQLLMAAAQLATHTGGYGVLITPAQAGDAASCCPVCQVRHLKVEVEQCAAGGVRSRLCHTHCSRHPFLRVSTHPPLHGCTGACRLH